MSAAVAKAFIAQREELGHPLLKYMPQRAAPTPPHPMPPATDKAADFLLEIGSEELPGHHVLTAIKQLKKAVPAMLDDLRLSCDDVYVSGTPRRLAVIVTNLSPRQSDLSEELRGPAAKIAFDADGNPTKAAQGFARGKGVDVNALIRKEIKGTEYVFAVKQTPGRPAAKALSEALPGLLKSITFPRSMRWLAGAQVGKAVAATAYSRPIRWLTALLGEQVIPFEYAGLNSGRITRGLRPEGSPDIEIPGAGDYRQLFKMQPTPLPPSSPTSSPYATGERSILTKCAPETKAYSLPVTPTPPSSLKQTAIKSWRIFCLGWTRSPFRKNSVRCWTKPNDWSNWPRKLVKC